MKIAVISDPHDDRERLAAALSEIRGRGISQGFHLGDITSPFIVGQLADSGLSWRCVRGNNDSDDPYAYAGTAGTFVDVSRQDFRTDVTASGRKVFLTHYPQAARIAARSGKYDACFYGHDHVAFAGTVIAGSGSEVLLANPGALHRPRDGAAGYGIWEPEKNTFEVVKLRRAGRGRNER